MSLVRSLLLTIAAALAGGCSESVARVGGSVSVAAPAEDPRVFAEVPDFALTSSSGETITRASLVGRPFVMGAIFTSCTGPCPAISSRMGRLQKALGNTEVRLVTITVDPEHDSPERLAAYAAGYGAKPDRWLFLTGTEEQVDALVRGGFLMAVDRAAPVERPPGQRVTHDTRLVAVDRQGRIRGWYDGRSEEGFEQLVARMRFLAGTED